MKMQNDAIRRAEDMQRRARQSAGLEREKQETQHNPTAKKEEPRRVPMPNDYLENLKNYGSNSSKNESEPREEEEKKKEQKQEHKNNNHPKFQNSFEDKMKSVFGDLNIDSDKALLLSLILLLSEEKADELLIMALIYMLT
jgi:hypothetical protein